MKLLSAKELVKKLCLSRTTIWRLEKRGDFPLRVKFTNSLVRWDESDVDEWIKSKLTNY